MNPFLRRNGKDSGLAGRKAEESAAKRFRGQLTPGSGALEGAKGDFKATINAVDFLMENKTTSGASMTLQKGWLLKIYQEALEMNKTPALSIQFTNATGGSEKRERWVMVPESVWLEMQ